MLFVLALPLVLALGVGVAWAVDERASDGKVARNTELAGIPVGGLTEAELGPIVAEVAGRFAEGVVRVDTPGGSFTLDGTEIDLRVDEAATIAAALEVGRRGAVTVRPLDWLASLTRPRTAPVRVTASYGAVHALVTERDPARTRVPREPSITGEGGEITVVDGRPGRGTDPAAVFDGIAEAARSGRLPVVVEVAAGSVPPRFTRLDAERLADRARALTFQPLEVVAGGVAASVPQETLRSWIRSEATRRGLELRIDAGAVQADMEELLPEAGTRPVDAGITLVNGRVSITPGRDGTACCDPAAARLVHDALLQGRAGPIELPLRTVPPRRSTEDARALGIREPVAEFTTSFAAGQSRVINIHRMADLVRGVIIEPGQTFSVNDHVGRRTRENGFAPGGAIEAGRFTEAIGGGVSQFATTLFNAAFFAGLDFAEYQAHTIYISRYPYGREATLSYPKPDLRITNNTPYGVLVWPTYTPSSITVTLWSTKHLEVEQSGQSRSSAGRCTRVTTERTTTVIATGERRVDRVHATYRPAEGVDC